MVYPPETGQPETAHDTVSKVRLYAGGAIFIAGFCSPLLIPLVLKLSLDAQTKSLVSGVLMLGVPELSMLISVAVLGRSGYDFLRKHVVGALLKWLFPERVGKLRHTAGMLLFVLPVIGAWIYPYTRDVWAVAEHELQLAIGGDLMLLAGLLLLGGEFWEKLRCLLIRDHELD